MDLREIPGFPNYSVTMGGRVWSKKREGTKGGWLKPGRNPDGYLTVVLCNGKMNTKKVHRLVLETYVGPCPKGMEGRHLDGVRYHNHLMNLKWGTRSENQLDSVRHGTHSMVGKFGEKHQNTKLSDKDRRMIIYQYSTGLFTQRELGTMYSVDHGTIGNLVKGKLWPFVNIVETMKALKIPRGQYV